MSELTPVGIYPPNLITYPELPPALPGLPHLKEGTSRIQTLERDHQRFTGGSMLACKDLVPLGVRAQLVFRDYLLCGNSYQRKQQEGDDAGAVVASFAMDQHSTCLCLRDCRDGSSVAFRPARECILIIKRRAP